MKQALRVAYPEAEAEAREWYAAAHAHYAADEG